MSKIKRSDKLAFLSVGSSYYRLKNFTEFSVSKNPVNYSRQYIDEDFERNDVVSYSPSISYSFDFDPENPVHATIADMTNNETVGNKALVKLIFVDISSNPRAECVATLRTWSLIPDKEGSDPYAYNYSGTLRANGQITFGMALSNDDWETCTFHE